MARPVIEAGDCTVSGNNTAQASWAVSHPAASTGDLLIFNVGWDDSTTTSSLTLPNGPNGESPQAIAGPVASASTEVRCQAWYYVATGSWSSSTVTVTPSATESWTATVIKVPAGEFDAADPIGNSGTYNSDSTTATVVTSPAFSAAATDNNGTLVWFTAVDTDPLSGTDPTGWDIIQAQDLGAVAHGVAVRTAAVTSSEAISSSTWGIAGDSSASIAYVVRASYEARVTWAELYLVEGPYAEAPGVGSLTLTGGTPTLRFDLVTAPDVLALALAGDAPTVSIESGADEPVEIGVDVGTTTLAGDAPTLRFDLVTSPAVGELTLTGGTPTLGIADTRTVPLGELVLAGDAPELRFDLVTSPAAGELAFTGLEPVPVSEGTAAPEAASLAITGTTPTVELLSSAEVSFVSFTVPEAPEYDVRITWAALSLVVAPLEKSVDTGAVTLAGTTPVLGKGAWPPVGELTLVGATPAASQSLFVMPAAGGLTITGDDVSTYLGPLFRPDEVALTITGHAPSIDNSYDITVDTGTLSVNGEVPVSAATGEVVCEPAAGSFEFTGTTPVASENVNTFPDVAELSITGTTPVSDQARTITPDALALLLAGYVPTIQAGQNAAPAAGSAELTGIISELFVRAYTFPDTSVLTLEGQGLVSSVTVASTPPNRAARIAAMEFLWNEKYADLYADLYVPNQGTVTYIDMQGSSGTGTTYTSPRNTIPTFVSGNTYLFKQSSYYTGTLSWGADNVLVGTYSSSDGSRVFDKSLLAEVRMDGNRFGVNAGGASTKVSGIKVIQTGSPYTATAAGTFAIYCSKSGGANNCTIEHCWVYDVTPGTAYQDISGGIYVRGSNALVRCNRLTNSELDSIYIGYNGASDGPNGLVCYGNYIDIPTTVGLNGPDGIQVSSTSGGHGTLQIYDNFIKHNANCKQAIIVNGTTNSSDYALVKQNILIGPDLAQTQLGPDVSKTLYVNCQNARIEGNYLEASSWGITSYGANSLLVGNTVVMDSSTGHEVGITPQASGNVVRNNTIVLLSGTCQNAIEQTSSSHSGIFITDNVIVGAFTWGIRYRATAVTEARNIVYGATREYTDQGGTEVAPSGTSSILDPALSAEFKPTAASIAVESAGPLSPAFVDIYGNTSSLLTPHRGSMQVLAENFSNTVIPVGEDFLSLNGTSIRQQLRFVQDAGELFFVGAQPSVVLYQLTYPATTALSMTGTVPSMSFGGPTTVDAGSMTLTGATPLPYTSSPINVGTCSLTISPYGPSIKPTAVRVTWSEVSYFAEPRIVTPDRCFLSLTGTVPIRIGPTILTPNAGTLTFNGNEPEALLTVSPNVPRRIYPVLFEMPPAFRAVVVRSVYDTSWFSLVALYNSPLPKVFTPPAGTLNLFVHQPDAFGPHRVLPGSGTLTVNSVAPGLGGNRFISVPTVNLTVTGHTPTLSLAERKAEVSWAALSVPYVATTLVRVPNAALLFSGNVPALRGAVPFDILVNVGGLVLTQDEPFVGISNLSTHYPPTGSLTVTGQTPTVDRTIFEFVLPPAGSLVLGGQIAQVESPYDKVIAAASAILAGYAPSSLVRNGLAGSMQPSVGRIRHRIQNERRIIYVDEDSRGYASGKARIRHRVRAEKRYIKV